MNELRDSLARLLWKVGLTPALVRRQSRRGRFALVMHGVSPAYDPTLPQEIQPHHTAQEMRTTLAWLSERFSFLTPQEFLETDKPGVLLTFDDGFANNAETLLPILEEFNAPAIFFITLQHIINPRDWLPATLNLVKKVWGHPSQVPEATAHTFFDGMTLSQLRACAAHPLVTVGSHTLSHPFLSKCSQTELVEEISGSKQKLEQYCGCAVELFAYPTGDYDARAVVCVQSAGYKAAFAVDPLRLSSPCFEIPRVGLYSSEPSYLGLKLSGLHRRPIIGNSFLRAEEF